MTTRDEVIAAVRNEPVTADFAGFCEGSLLLIKPLTIRAAEWLYDNINANAQWSGGAVIVDHRYVDAIVEGARAAGFTFEGERTEH